jgi:hypothetical protein
MANQHSAEPNFLLDHPGWVGAGFAICVVAIFLGALFATAPSEREGKHHEGAASGAPSSSAPAK